MKKRFIQTGIGAFLNRLLARIFGAGGAYYINGPEVLPPPLSPDAERRLVELSATDPAARDELIVHNLRLVVYISKKFDAGSSNAEDLISIGTIGLIKAVNTFRADKNIKLATYASRCIENEILMYLRKIGGRRGELSLEQPLNTDKDGNELLLGDLLGSDGGEIGGRIESADEQRELMNSVMALPEREREILCLRFGLFGGAELTQKEVADKLGISQSYISRLEKKVIGRLRRELEKIV